MERRLTLRREPLATLTDDDLAAVAGGAPATPGCPESHDCPTKIVDCLADRLSIARCG